METPARQVFGNRDLRALLLRTRAAGMLDDLVREGAWLRAADAAARAFDRDCCHSFRRLCARNGWHWKHRHAEELQRAAEDLYNRSHAFSYELVVLKNTWECDVSLHGDGFTLDWFFRALPDTKSRGGELLPIRPCSRMDRLRSSLHAYRRRMYALARAADEFGARRDAFAQRFPLLAYNAALPAGGQ